MTGSTSELQFMPPWLAAALRPWLEIPQRLRRMERMMVTQEQIGALTDKVQELTTALTHAESEIRTELARLASQGVDTTALETALDNLAGQVQAAEDIIPDAPDAPVDPGAPAVEPNPVPDPITGVIEPSPAPGGGNPQPDQTLPGDLPPDSAP